MKKILLIILSFSVFQSLGQSAAANLQRYCYVEHLEDGTGSSASYIVKHSKGIRVDQFASYTFQNDDYSYHKKYIPSLYAEGGHFPLENMANNLWSLISRQLNGEAGALPVSPKLQMTDSFGNLQAVVSPVSIFPTYDEYGNKSLIMAYFDFRKQKWFISNTPIQWVYELGMMYKHTKVFSRRA
ncbi:hypothetical protein [Leadbetterella sp. DM7]|uniref:hypothetical protein n=1 Tax=Leadbetterella sp. DM7 TaxID=3235085 RepID=UPI00349EBC05